VIVNSSFLSLLFLHPESLCVFAGEISQKATEQLCGLPVVFKDKITYAGEFIGR
jgi:hypothetical protein